MINSRLGAGFLVDRVLDPRAGQRYVVGHLIDVSVREVEVIDGKSSSTEPQVSATFSITLTVNGGDVSAIAADVTVGGDITASYGFDAQLGGKPLRIDARLDAEPTMASHLLAAPMDAPTGPLRLSSAALTADPEVTKPSNPLHQTADAAIDVLAASVDDLDFASVARSRLFPDGLSLTTVHQVQATRDWVMFQHRADRTVAVTSPIVSPLPQRTYEVYLLALADRDQVAPFAQAMRKDADGALHTSGIRPVDRVSFAGGTPDLLSSPAGLVSAWQGSGPGGVITVAAIAVHGRPEPGSIDISRALRVTEVVSSVSTPDPGLVSMLLPEVPAALNLPGLDGVMVLATIPRSATTCIDVRRYKIGDIPKEFTATSAMEFIEQSKELGSVTFTATQVAGGLAEVAQNWQDTGGGSATDAFLITKLGDDRAGSPADLAARAGAIIAELGGQTSPKPGELRQDLPSTCPAVLLLRAKDTEPETPQTRGPGHELFAVRGQSQSWKKIESRLDDGVLDEQTLEQLTGDDVIRPLGSMVFKPGSADFAAASTIRRVADAGDPFDQARVTQVVSVYDPDHLSEDRAVVLEQAAKLAAEAGAEGLLARIVAETQPPLQKHEVLTLLITDRE
jgi:hypothetical protein